MNTVLSISQSYGEQILAHYLLHGKVPSVNHQYKHRIQAALFLQLDTPNKLYRVINRQFKTLQRLIQQPVYRVYHIPKKRGGQRLIEVPEPELVQVQKSLNFFLQCYYTSLRPAPVHGFIRQQNKHFKSLSIISNAEAHINKTAVLNIDLKDFFQNISSQQIYQLFRSPLFNFNENMAAAYTLLCTYNGHLPTGAPSSPILSNFICLSLDKALEQFSLLNELTYTRYADDLTFSSNQTIGTNTILDIINLIQENGFKVNDKKVRITGRRGRQLVTGLVVNQRVNVDRRYIRELRATIHHLKLNGLPAASTKHFKLDHTASDTQQQHFLKRLNAKIAFVGSVRGKFDPVYLKLKRGFAEGLGENVRVR